MRRFLLAGGLMCFLVCPSFSQTNDSSDSAEAMKALAREVRELRAQVAELQAKQAKLEQALSLQQGKKDGRARWLHRRPDLPLPGSGPGWLRRRSVAWVCCGGGAGKR